MVTVQIFDKPMCCSTGICGPQVDPALVQFAANLDWLRSLGVAVERFNLAQQPDKFVENTAVQALLQSDGIDCLPLIFVHGVLVERSVYPDRETLGRWSGVGEPNRPSNPSLFPMISDCCERPGCC